jgi:integrase
MTTNPQKPGWEQVYDAAGERSRGLWKRGERFYVQTTVTDPQTGLENVRRILLPSAKTEPQARKEAANIRDKASKGEIFRRQGSPMLADYIPHYLANAHKSQATMSYEKIYLNRWLDYLGNVRLSNITPAQVLSYRTKQLETVSARSVNNQVIALRNMLKMAAVEGKIQDLPFDGIVQLKHRSKKKPLLSPEQVERIIANAKEYCPRSGQQFGDYVKLLAYSGAREKEAMSLQWINVSFERGLIEFKNSTKFGKIRFLNFNPKLEAHLKDMHSRKGDSPLLFPSKRTGNPITSFKTTQLKIEAKTGLDFSDHSFRHYFASMCVMAGIDFMTISRWLGHDDGGVLVGKTYGHLSNAHMIEAAKKLTF